MSYEPTPADVRAVAEQYADGTLTTAALHVWLVGRMEPITCQLEADLWYAVLDTDDGTITEDAAREDIRAYLARDGGLVA